MNVWIEISSLVPTDEYEHRQMFLFTIQEVHKDKLNEVILYHY